MDSSIAFFILFFSLWSQTHLRPCRKNGEPNNKNCLGYKAWSSFFHFQSKMLQWLEPSGSSTSRVDWILFQFHGTWLFSNPYQSILERHPLNPGHILLNRKVQEKEKCIWTQLMNKFWNSNLRNRWCYSWKSLCQKFFSERCLLEYFKRF